MEIVRNIAMLAVLAALPVQAADLIVEEDQQRGRHDCRGASAIIDGNQARLQLVGCSRVVLNGNFNEIEAVDTGRIDVFGNDNRVRWSAPAGKAPSLSDLGSRNQVVEGAAGAAPSAGGAAPPATVAEVLGDAGALIEQLGARVSADRIELSLGSDVLFDFNSAAIQQAALPRLAQVGELIRQRGRGQVLVIGHTDAIGDEASNLALSRRRAQAVADWLQQHASVEPARLRLQGLGETQPVAPNTRADGSDHPEGRARNRRVDILMATRADVVLEVGSAVTLPTAAMATDSARSCAAGSTCREDCTQGNCRMNCPAGAHCFYGCAGGDCIQECSAGAHCEFSCRGGNCQQSCALGADCRKQCEGGECR
jgi:outer membrane protein OmpA-like peptidoglycan-associated protein